MATRYVNTAATVGGDGTTNGLTGGTAAYSTLLDAITDELLDTPDRVTATDGLTFICTGGEDDFVNDGPSITGFTVNATYYITVRAAVGDEAGTEWDTSKYHMHLESNGNENVLYLGDTFCRVYNLQGEYDVSTIEAAGRYCRVIGGGVDVVQNSSVTYIVGNHFRITGTSAYESTEPCGGVHMAPNDNDASPIPIIHIYNNIFSLEYTNSFTRIEAINVEHRTNTTNAYNNTILGPWTRGISGLRTSSARYTYSKNNIIDGSIIAITDFDNGTDDPGADGYSDYNTTNDATFATGYTTQPNDRVGQTYKFVSATDFALTNTDDGARGHGLFNPSIGLYYDDINGTSRVPSDGWDMGAHRAAESPGTKGFIPRRVVRTQKPSSFVKVNNGNPLTRGLSFLFAFPETGGSTARNSFSSTNLTLVNGAEFRVGPYGQHLYMDATNDYAEGTNVDGSVEQNAVDGLTIMVKFQMLTHSGTSASVLAQERPGNSFAWWLQSTAVTGDYRFGLESGNYSGTVTDPDVRTTPIWLVAKWNSTDTTQRIYLYDGITGDLVDSDTTGTYVGSITWQTAAPDFRITLNDFSADYDEKNYYFAGAWGRELSLGEVESIIANEHQLLQPQHRPIPTYVAPPLGEFSSIATQVPWTRKPSTKATLNYAHPLLKNGLGTNGFVVDHNSLNAPYDVSGKHVFSTRASSTTSINTTSTGVATYDDGDANGGLDSPDSDCSWGGATQFTIMAVIRNTSLPTSGNEHEVFRWTNPTNSGVAVALLDDGGTAHKLRTILDTDGTAIWSASYDIVLGDISGQDWVVGMSWDGVNRYMYGAPLGEPTKLLQTQACTGSVVAGAGDFHTVVHGGLHTQALSEGYQYLTVATEKYSTQAAISEFSRNPWGIFQPRTQRIPTYLKPVDLFGFVPIRNIPPKKKPTRHTNIDSSNDLGRMVMAAYLPPSHYSAGIILHRIDGTGTIVNTPRGRALRCDANDEGWSGILPESLRFGGAISIGMVADLKAAPVAHSNLFGIALSNADTSPYNRIQFKYDGANIVMGGEDDLAGYTVASGGTYPANSEVVVSGHIGNDYAIYVNDDPKGTNGAQVAPTPSWGTDPETALGDVAAVSRHPNADIHLGVIFKGELTDAQHASFNANPWQIFQSSPRWIPAYERTVLDSVIYGFVPRYIPWTKKPSSFTKYNAGNSLTKGLCLLFSFNDPGGAKIQRSSIGNTKLDPITGATMKVDQYGSHAYTDGTNDEWSTSTLTSDTTRPTTAITVMTRMRYLSSGATTGTVFSATPEGSVGEWGITADGWTTVHDPRFVLAGAQRGSVDTRTPLGGLDVNDLTPIWLIMKWTSGGAVTMEARHDNGALLINDGSNPAQDITGNLTDTLTYPAGTRLYINNTDGYAEKNVYFSSVWDRELSDAEIQKVISNPYQLLQPPTRWVPISGTDAVSTPVAPPVGPSTFYETLAILSSATLGLVKQVNKIASTTSASVVSLVKQVAKTLSITSATTLSFVKQVAKTLSITSATTAALTPLKTILKALSASAGSTVSLVKQVAKTLSTTSATTLSLVKQMYEVLSTTSATTAALTPLKTILKALSASAGSTVSLVKQMAKTLSITSATTLSFVKQVAKTITTTAASVVTLTPLKTILKTISATAGATLGFVKTVLKPMAVTSATVVSLVREISLIISTTSAATLGLVKQIPKTIATTAASVATLTPLKTLLRTLSTTAGTTIGFVKTVLKPMAVTSATVLSFVKTVLKPMAVTSATVLILIPLKTLLRTLSATAGTTVGFVKTILKPMAVTSATVLSFVKTVLKPIAVTSAATLGLVKQIPKIIATTASSVVTLTPLKTLLRVLSATAGATVGFVKQVTKIITATAASVATLTPLKILLRTLSATAGATVGLVRQIPKIIATTASSVVTLTPLKTVLKVIAATAGATVGFVKTVLKPIAVTSATVVSFVREIAMTLATTAASVISLSISKTYDRILSITAGTVVTLTPLKTLLRTLAATASTTVLNGKFIYKNILVTASTVADTIRLFFKTITITSATTAVLSKFRIYFRTVFTTAGTFVADIQKQVNKIMLVTSSSVVGVVRLLSKVMLAVSGTSTSIYKQVSKTINATASAVVAVGTYYIDNAILIYNVVARGIKFQIVKPVTAKFQVVKSAVGRFTKSKNHDTKF